MGKSIWAFSGGGARGSFEAGVGLYLSFYEEKPQTIYGSSTGSLCGVILAEGGTESGKKLVQLYNNGIKTYRDMYDFPKHTLDVFESFEHFNNQSCRKYIVLPTKEEIFKETYGLHPVFWDGNTEEKLLKLEEEEKPQFRESILDIITKLDELRDLKDKDSEKFLRFCLVRGLLAAKDVKKALTKLLKQSHIATLKPIKDLLASSIDFQKLENSDIDLSIIFANLVTGKPAWVNKFGQISNDGQKFYDPVNKEVDMINAVTGSASMPIMFEPQQIYYKNNNIIENAFGVDGGTFDILPNRDIPQDADKSIFVLASPVADIPKISPDLDLVNIAKRVGSMAFSEITQADLEVAKLKSNKPIVIDPLFAVHERTEIEPGLIRINIAYGYMRAYDQINHPDNKILMSNTHDIINLRLKAWSLERRHIQFKMDVRPNEGEKIPPFYSVLKDTPRWKEIFNIIFKSSDEGLEVQHNLKSEWALLGYHENYYLLWEPGTLNQVREVKLEIKTKIEERNQLVNNDMKCLPPAIKDTYLATEGRVEEWWSNFEAHNEMERLSDFSPYSQHLDFNIHRV